MKPSQILLALFFVVLTAASSLAGKHGVAKDSGTTEGTFAGIEKGDYTHFLIKNKKGVADSFIILHPTAAVQAYLDNPDKLKGRKVRVYWKEEAIPESGGKEKTVLKVEARAPLDH